MRRLIMSLVWNFAAGSAFSAPAKTLVLRGVDVAETSASGGLSLTVDIECGEHLKGVLVREEGDRVGVAVAVERPEVRCGGGAETRSLTIPFINSKGLDVVALPDDQGDIKVVLQEASLASSGVNGLAIEWDNVCRPMLGVLLMPQDNGTVGVAAGLAAGARKAKGVTCEGGRRGTTLTSIRTNQANWSMANRPGKLEDLYAIRVVAPASVKVTSDGLLSMSWQRRCREIALGVLFGEDSPSTVAVVTAYLPNVTCTGSKMLSEITTIDALTLASAAKLKPMTKLQAQNLNRVASNLRLLAPDKIEFVGLNRSVTVKSTSVCGKRIGTVIGKDSVGNINMANLTAVTSESCTVRSSAVKSVLPLQVSTELNPRIFPLRVMGSAAH